MNLHGIAPDRIVGHAPLARVELAVCALSQAAIAIMMVTVVVDVVMRYFFSSPLGWTYDIISSYLMICLLFFSISDGLRMHSHIAIDVFSKKLPKRFVDLSLAVGFLASAVLMALIVWQGWGRLSSSWEGGDIISMTVPWPTWPTYFMVCLGGALMALRCLIRGLAHFGSLVTGRQLASRPASAEGASGESDEGL